MERFGTKRLPSVAPGGTVPTINNVAAFSSAVSEMRTQLIRAEADGPSDGSSFMQTGAVRAALSAFRPQESKSKNSSLPSTQPVSRVSRRVCGFEWNPLALDLLWREVRYGDSQLDYLSAVFNKLLAAEDSTRFSTSATAPVSLSSAFHPLTAGSMYRRITARQLGRFWRDFSALGDAPYLCQSAVDLEAAAERLGFLFGDSEGRVDLVQFTRCCALLDVHTPHSLSQVCGLLRLLLVFLFFADDSLELHSQSEWMGEPLTAMLVAKVEADIRSLQQSEGAEEESHADLAKRLSSLEALKGSRCYGRTAVWSSHSYLFFRKAMLSSPAVEAAVSAALPETLEAALQAYASTSRLDFPRTEKGEPLIFFSHFVDLTRRSVIRGTSRLFRVFLFKLEDGVLVPFFFLNSLCYASSAKEEKKEKEEKEETVNGGVERGESAEWLRESVSSKHALEQGPCPLQGTVTLPGLSRLRPSEEGVRVLEEGVLRGESQSSQTRCFEGSCSYAIRCQPLHAPSSSSALAFNSQSPCRVAGFFTPESQFVSLGLEEERRVSAGLEHENATIDRFLFSASRPSVPPSSFQPSRSHLEEEVVRSERSNARLVSRKTASGEEAQRVCPSPAGFPSLSLDVHRASELPVRRSVLKEKEGTFRGEKESSTAKQPVRLSTGSSARPLLQEPQSQSLAGRRGSCVVPSFERKSNSSLDGSRKEEPPLPQENRQTATIQKVASVETREVNAASEANASSVSEGASIPSVSSTPQCPPPQPLRLCRRSSLLPPPSQNPTNLSLKVPSSTPSIQVPERLSRGFSKTETDIKSSGSTDSQLARDSLCFGRGLSEEAAGRELNKSGLAGLDGGSRLPVIEYEKREVSSLVREDSHTKLGSVCAAVKNEKETVSSLQSSGTVLRGCRRESLASPISEIGKRTEDEKGAEVALPPKQPETKDASLRLADSLRRPASLDEPIAFASRPPSPRGAKKDGGPVPGCVVRLRSMYETKPSDDKASGQKAPLRRVPFADPSHAVKQKKDRSEGPAPSLMEASTASDETRVAPFSKKTQLCLRHSNQQTPTFAQLDPPSRSPSSDACLQKKKNGESGEALTLRAEKAALQALVVSQAVESLSSPRSGVSTECRDPLLNALRGRSFAAAQQEDDTWLFAAEASRAGFCFASSDLQVSMFSPMAAQAAASAWKEAAVANGELRQLQNLSSRCAEEDSGGPQIEETAEQSLDEVRNDPLLQPLVEAAMAAVSSSTHLHSTDRLEALAKAALASAVATECGDCASLTGEEKEDAKGKKEERRGLEDAARPQKNYSVRSEETLEELDAHCFALPLCTLPNTRVSKPEKDDDNQQGEAKIRDEEKANASIEQRGLTGSTDASLESSRSQSLEQSKSELAAETDSALTASASNLSLI